MGSEDRVMVLSAGRLKGEGFSSSASGKEPTCHCRRHKRRRFDLLSQEDALEEEMTTYSSILVWRIHGQRSLAGCNP